MSVGLRCKQCGGDETSVIETRQHRAGIYRRRACDRCGARHSTIEATRSLWSHFVITLRKIKPTTSSGGGFPSV